jgi:hypothetical protein
MFSAPSGETYDTVPSRTVPSGLSTSFATAGPFSRGVVHSLPTIVAHNETPKRSAGEDVP